MPVYKLLGGGDTQGARAHSIAPVTTLSSTWSSVTNASSSLSNGGRASGREGMKENLPRSSAPVKRSAPTAISCSIAGWPGTSGTRWRCAMLAPERVLVAKSCNRTRYAVSVA